MQNQTLLITIIILLLLIIIIIVCYINLIIYNKKNIESTIKRIPKKKDLYNEELILKKYIKSIKNKSIDINIPIDEVGYPLF